MKIIISSMVATIIVMFATSAQAQDKVIDFNQLPKAAQDFITTYYDQKDVVYVTEDSGFLSGKEYEVRLADGKEIEFDSRGSWKEVDAKKEAVPADIVLAAIRDYVNKSFPNNLIVQIKKSGREYEIELSSGLDLEFDARGRFLRIDD